MKRVQIRDTRKWCEHRDARFLLLGTRNTPATLSQSARDRLFGTTRENHADLWGTLGPWDAHSPALTGGVLEFSRRGNDHSLVDESGEETVELIAQTRASLPETRSRVRERFIDLRKVVFESLSSVYKLDAPPSLQLTVFVEPGEGALVHVIHGAGQDEWAELVQPEFTEPDHTCSKRSRLHYRVGLWPTELGASQTKAGKTVYGAGTGGQVDTDMVIKILTFRRDNSTSAQVVRRALARLGRDKYGVQRWSTRGHRFEPVAPTEIDRKARTLLVLHGTFSSTSGSFGDLTESADRSWAAATAAHGRYGQILGFDHETLFDDVGANARHLRALTQGGFTRPLDVLTHSRGGLLAKHLALHEQNFEVQRGVLCACANGVGYLALPRNLSILLSVLRKMGRFSTLGHIAVVLGQHSVDFVRALPGLDAMRPGSARLRSVMKRKTPAGRTQSKLLPLVGDWNPPRRWKRWAGGPVDRLLQVVLGREHDWVVGCTEQAILHPSQVPSGFDPKPYGRRMHTRSLRDPQPRKLARNYLLQGVVRY